MTIGTAANRLSARRAGGRRGDLVFRGVSLAAGVLVLAVLVAIAAFLVAKAVPAIRADKADFFTAKSWDPDVSGVFGVAALAYGTVLAAVVALVVAVPTALGVAVYIVEYAPRRLSRLLGYGTDMLAAVPSVIYGLWAVFFLLPHIVPLQHFLGTRLSFIPLFSAPGTDLATVTHSMLVAGLILAIMILPIIAAVSREVLLQVDPALREAALALGATRWEMIRMGMLPPSRGGIVGGIMLGLGRALGETIAVALILSGNNVITTHLLTAQGNTIAANIATQFGEAGSLGRNALIASGLVLFVITLAVNLGARAIIYRAGAVERSAAV